MPAQGDVIVNVLPGFVVLAAGIGMTFVSATTTAFREVAHDDAGMASGLVSTSHELGLALGVAVASTIAAASLGGAAAAVAGFQAAFLASAIIAVAAAGVAFLLPTGRPTADAPLVVH
jgi:sugar phosphate permease